MTQTRAFLRLPATTAFAVVRHDPENGPAGVSGQVRRAFSGAFGDRCAMSTHRVGPRISVVVLHPATDALPAALDALAWGTPIGAHGLATDAELTTGLASPEAARAWLGRFVIVGSTADLGVRLVVSAEMVHTLKTCSGPRGEVVATSGMLAALLSGRGVAICPDRVGEYLVSDFVVGSEELLDGVAVVDEASVVHVRDSETTTNSYWPLEDRLAPTPASPAQLLAHVAANAARVFAVPTARLSLTAGRDSVLVAAAAKVAGCAPGSFTFGPAEYGDVRGAAAVAAAAGLDHARVFRARRRRITWARISDVVAWTDGLASAREMYGAPWVGLASEAQFVTGHGGEVGRAFFWKHRDDAAMRAFAGSFGEVLPDPHRTTARERVAAELGRYAFTDSPASALDLFYARNRVRKWTCRAIRREQVVGTVHGLADPATLRLLLGIPEEQRRDGSFFEATLALDPLHLHTIAKEAAAAPVTVRPSMWPARFATAEQRDVLRLGVESLGRGSFVADVFGRRWLAALIRRASRRDDNYSRRILWNALAVDGLARALH